MKNGKQEVSGGQQLQVVDLGEPGRQEWAKLGAALGKVRVVMLGEQSHGDGAAFCAKADLVRYLYEEHGFEVLAIESCFYSLSRVWQQLQSREAAREQLPAQVYGHWREASEMQPLWELVAERFGSQRPLVVTGIDPRHAPYARRHLSDDLENFLSRQLPAVLDDQRLPEFRRVLGGLLEREYRHSLDGLARKLFIDVLWDIRDATVSLEGAEAAFWTQELNNLESAARLAWSFVGRDRGMANNLLWLATKRFPDRKLMVWAHNWHVVRSKSTVALADAGYGREFDKHPDTPMGELISASLPQVFSLALVSGSGETRPLAYSGDYRSSEAIPAPAPESLEAHLLERGGASQFVDLRKTPGQRFVMSGLEHGRPLELAWAQVFDGVLFQREMHGLTVKENLSTADAQAGVNAEGRESAVTGVRELDAGAAAREFIDALFPRANAALLAGSVVRGEVTASSDLDIVIIDDSQPGSYRETFARSGWPIEAFVYPRQGYRNWFERDVERRRPALIRMCAEGLVLRDRQGAAARLQQEARELLNAGPGPLSAKELDWLRYRVTDLLMDLEDARDDGEILHIVMALVPLVTDLACDLAGQWRGAAKWAPRMLRSFDNSLTQRLDVASRSCLSGSGCRHLIEVADEVLARAGGRLFAGFAQGKQGA